MKDPIDNIESVTIGLLEYYGTNNPYEILSDMGVTIKEVPPNADVLKGNESIFIDYLNTVFIRDDLPYKFKLFYLRHELGHILLHLDEGNILLLNHEKHEKEADIFALKLTDITFDEVEMYQLTLEQIASYLELPIRTLERLVTL